MLHSRGLELLFSVSGVDPTIGDHQGGRPGKDLSMMCHRVDSLAVLVRVGPGSDNA
jgi:hypothetical protein